MLSIPAIVNKVENYESSEKVFPPRWEYYHRGENISTAVIIISTAVVNHATY